MQKSPRHLVKVKARVEFLALLDDVVSKSLGQYQPTGLEIGRGSKCGNFTSDHPLENSHTAWVDTRARLSILAGVIFRARKRLLKVPPMLNSWVRWSVYVKEWNHGFCLPNTGFPCRCSLQWFLRKKGKKNANDIKLEKKKQRSKRHQIWLTYHDSPRWKISETYGQL